MDLKVSSPTASARAFRLPLGTEREHDLLYAFGTTLGKLIYGINFPTKLRFLKALRRSVLVWYGGLGVGLPLVTVLTLAFARRNLSKTGKTTWDAKLGLDVAHTPLSVRRWVAVVGSWVGLTFVVAVCIYS
jgi:hypothetical protein